MGVVGGSAFFYLEEGDVPGKIWREGNSLAECLVVWCVLYIMVVFCPVHTVPSL